MDWHQYLLEPEPGASLRLQKVGSFADLVIPDRSHWEYRMQYLGKAPPVQISEYFLHRWLPLLGPDWLAIISILRRSAESLNRDVAPSMPELANAIGLSESTLRRRLDKRKNPFPGVPPSEWPHTDPRKWVEHLGCWWYVPWIIPSEARNRPAMYNVLRGDVLLPVDHEDGGARFAALCRLSKPEFRALFGGGLPRLFVLDNLGSSAGSPPWEKSRATEVREADVADSVDVVDVATSWDQPWTATTTTPATAPTNPTPVQDRSQNAAPGPDLAPCQNDRATGKGNPAPAALPRQIDGEERGTPCQTDGDSLILTGQNPSPPCQNDGASETHLIRPCPVHDSEHDMAMSWPVDSLELGRAPDLGRLWDRLLAFGVWQTSVEGIVANPEGPTWATWWLHWSAYLNPRTAEDLPRMVVSLVRRAAQGNHGDQTPPAAYLLAVRSRFRELYPALYAELDGEDAPADRRKKPSPTRVIPRPAGPTAPAAPSELAALWQRVLAVAGKWRTDLAAGHPVRLEPGGRLVVALPGILLERLARDGRREALATAITSQIREVRELALIREGTEGTAP